MSRIRRVVRPHEASYADPLSVSAGETVFVVKADTKWPFVWVTNREGKGGWIPESYVSPSQLGEPGTVSAAYDTCELTVRQGELLESFEEVGGWEWCSNRSGESGWVPVENLAD